MRSESLALLLFTVFTVFGTTGVRSTFAQSTTNSAASPRTAVDSKPEEEVITIECTAATRLQQAGGLESFLFAAVELPGLEAAKKYKLKINILNSSQNTIRFSRISASCGCATIEAEDNEIPSMASGQVIMHLDVPNKTLANRAQIGAKFLSPESPQAALSLIVSYEVLSSFGFGGDRINIDLPKGEPIVVAKVPVLIVPPLTVDALEIKLSDNLQDVNAKIVSDDPEIKVPYVELSVASKNVSRGGILGELILQRPGTNHVSGVTVNIRHEDPFRLRPESIRLSRDNKLKPYKANAMLRVSKKEHRNNHVGQEQKGESGEGGGVRSVEQVPPHVELTIAGQAARVQLDRLGGEGIYRVTIVFDGKIEGSATEPLEVRWAVVLDGETHVIESQAFLANVNQ